MGAQMSSYSVVILSGCDPMVRNYRPMIYSDWMKSLRFGNDWYKMIDSDAYYSIYEQIIDKLLCRENATVRLALMTDDLDLCCGWSLSEGSTLHYMFVKKDGRNQGIGTSLMPKDLTHVSHLTKIGQAIRKSKYPDVIFNPFI